MKWRIAVVGLVAGLVVGSVAGAISPVGRGASSASALPLPQAPAAPAVVPASQRVFMVADSVGLGAKTAMPKAFPADWQVTVTGQPALFVEQLVSKYVQYQPLSMFGDSAIVAGGYNYPYWDPARFDRSIDLMVNTLKAKGVKRIFWVTMREVKPQYFSGWATVGANYQALYLKYPTANASLRAALLRHPELSLIDWAAVTDQTGLTYDAIHLNPTGAARYTALAASTVVSAATRRPAGTVTEVAVTGAEGVPPDAAAVSLNLTAVNPRTGGYLAAYPCGGEVPGVSNLNFWPAQTVAGATVVPVGVDGKVCVYQSTDAHVLVDLNGAFGADSGFIALTPQRAIDTRSGPPPQAHALTPVHLGALEGAPTGAFTAVVNLTVVGGTTGAGVMLYACDAAQPAQVARNIAPGSAQNLTMVATTDANGDVCVKVSQSVHVIVDLFGAFPPEADIHALTAQRLLDTRTSGGALAAGAQRAQQVSGLVGVPGHPLPTGAVLTVTLVGPQGIGFATVFPCDASRPNTSVVNVVPNREQTNSVIPALDATGAACVYTSVTSHVLIDVSGWAGTAFLPVVPVRVLDTRVTL
ncbi:MAG: hypothetical protein Q7V88_19420 [Actinomycetota bacterium]|nr:hypothetical protein [Actinomycetota bacterium]